MPHILLTGAGFSRNWGGWLADEAFEYLLGCPKVSKELLWRYKRAGGFEAAYDELQTESAKPGRSVALLNEATDFAAALRGMFADMNKAFSSIESFESHNSPEYQIRSCLFRFDAIFTLNQDVLMEQHYLTRSFVAASHGRWNGWQIPGMQQRPGTGPKPHESVWSPLDASKFVIESNQQPYLKLHGSSNWVDERDGRQVLVIGGNKPHAINQHAILKWNNERFNEYLSKPDTRLMVIGYSFGDEHINEAIGEAVDRGNVRLFIIDPRGVDVLVKEEKPGDKLFWTPTTMAEWDQFGGKLQRRFRNRLIGASRRRLREIFGGDLVEHAKVMRFFS